MPTDVTLRGASVVIDVPSSTTAVVPKPTGTVDGDLIIVQGAISGGGQITPPAGWTRINGAVSNTQAFWRRASGEPASWTFTWDGSNIFNEFNAFSFFSLSGGTVSFNVGAFTVSPGQQTSVTSVAVTPGADALVFVDYLEFVHDETGPPIGPAALTLIQQDGGVGAPTDWSGSINVASGVSSGTFVAKTNGGDPNTPWQWYVGTYALISTSSTGRTALLSDETIYAPAIRSIADITFCGSTNATAFPIFSGATLSIPRPAGLIKGDLMIANIWSNGSIPGQFPFLFSGIAPFISVPVGWTILPGSFLQNLATDFPPSASWIFYKVATSTEPATYDWVLPRPTLNIWTGIIFTFCNTDPVRFFDGNAFAQAHNGSPKAPSLSPDWRNDVSFLVFVNVNPPGDNAWPALPNAPPGYIRLGEVQNQGTQAIGYLGVPNSCNPVPDVFAYTEAQQITQFGAVRYSTGWFAYSFLLKNVNVTGLACALGPGPPPPPAGGSGSGTGLFNDTILLRYMGTSKGFSLLRKMPADAQIITLKEVQTPLGGTGGWPLAGNGDAAIIALTNDLNSYILFAGQQDGTITATAITQPLPTPSDILEEYWDTDKHFDYLYAEGADLTNFNVSFSIDGGNTFNIPQALTKKFKVGMRGKSLVIKLTHAVATINTPLISHLKLTYGIEGLTAQ